MTAPIDSKGSVPEVTRRRFMSAGAGAILAAPISFGALELFLAACQAGSSSSSGPAGLLRIAVANDTETLDANATSFLRSSEMCLALFDTLTTSQLTKQGFNAAHPVPAFASSVDVNSSKTVFDFIVPSGRKFASGNPITVDDIVWSLQRMAASSLGGFYYGSTAVDPKNPVVKVDDTHFRISTLSPSNFLLQVLALSAFAIFDSKTMKTNATPDDPWAKNWAKTNAAGSGPYVISSYTAGASTELKRNPNFTRYQVGFEKLSMPIVPSPADRIALLTKADVDIALDIPLERLNDLKSSPGVQIVRAPSLTQHVIRMNNTVGPFKNQDLRKAVSYAIPYDDILKNVYYGFAGRLRGPVPGGALGYDSTYQEFKTDLTKAKTLADGTGLTPLDIDLVYNTAIPELTAAAAIVREALAQIRINVTLKPTPAAAFAPLRTNHKTPFFMDIQQLFVNDPAYQLVIFKSGLANNLVNYSNSAVDGLIAQLIAETDAAKRMSVAADIQRSVVADAPLVWLAQPDLTYALSKSLANFWPHPSSLIYYGYITKK
jgi:peptide/nickel transport system substrate-binding protein